MDVKTLCLGVLSLGDASGYEIRKMFEEGPFSHIHHASFGSIYPALSKLLEAGYVSQVVEAQDGRPDKKVYSITEEGLGAFRKTLGKTPDSDKVRSEVLIMMFFADHLEDDHLQEVYDNYVEHHRFFVELIESKDNSGLSRGRMFVRNFGLHFHKSILGFLEDNREALLSAPKGEGVRDFESLRECMDHPKSLPQSSPAGEKK
ncbi:PadR family transcriptional regulator [Magnetovibrio sp. PR-2]|uniref:PadR family transcriptional regulator n=1 Tax=Magnetovibrio sp. PR-2 TaxID=3120356 RepID=UPI002FCE17D0